MLALILTDAHAVQAEQVVGESERWASFGLIAQVVGVEVFFVTRILLKMGAYRLGALDVLQEFRFELVRESAQLVVERLACV